MSHEEFLKIKVTDELLDEWFADLSLCEFVEGELEEESEEGEDEG
jgi:hypothetical protein